MNKAKKLKTAQSGDILIKIPKIKFSPPRKSAASADDEVVKIKIDFSFAKLKYFIFFLAVVTGITGGIISIYAYNNFVDSNALDIPVVDIKDVATEEQIKALVTKMSQIIVLPLDELPEVLVISDLTQLRANPFFKDAAVGDYIVIYKKAGRVMVYNPKAHKIVNIGPYETESPPATDSAKLQQPIDNQFTPSDSETPQTTLGPQAPTPEPTP